MGHTKRLKEGSPNPEDIVFGAKAIISGMFRQNREQGDGRFFLHADAEDLPKHSR